MGTLLFTAETPETGKLRSGDRRGEKTERSLVEEMWFSPGSSAEGAEIRRISGMAI
jgi:hypothetical protein